MYRKMGEISVYAFEDNGTINGEPDIGSEHGLAGLEVRFSDAVGRNHRSVTT